MDRESDPDIATPLAGDDAPTEPELTDKLDRIAGGRTVSEAAPQVPRGPRGARAAALQALYEQDMSGHPAIVALKNLPVYARLALSHAEKAERLVQTASQNRADFDARIGSVAKEFPTSQMGTIDRNILRIALAELEPGSETPRGVIANEAVELAKMFGSDSSPTFINGVLGALLR